MGAFVSDAGEPSDADMARECASALRLVPAPEACAAHAVRRIHAHARLTSGLA